MTGYLLDANVFIQAKNLHYGFDFCPAFWDWLIQQNQAGRVASVEKVADEIHRGGDELAEWARNRGDDFFLRPGDAVVGTFNTVSDWVNKQGYEPGAVATFLQVADYWLITHALAHNYTVVTHEIPADTVRKVKIPNACIGLGLRCINPYDMLRREGARFILQSV